MLDIGFGGLGLGAPPPVSVCNAYSISIRLETKRPLTSAANMLDIGFGGLGLGAPPPVSVCNAYSISIRLETMWPLTSAANMLDIGFGAPRTRCASDSVRLRQYPCAMHTAAVFAWRPSGD